MQLNVNFIVILVLSATLITYNFFIFNVFSTLLESKYRKAHIYICNITNYIFFMLCFVSGINQVYLYILFFFILMLEYILFYKGAMLKFVFFAGCIMLFFMAFNFFIGSVFAMNYRISIYEILENRSFNLASNIISIWLSMAALAILRKTISRRLMDRIGREQELIKFIALSTVLFNTYMIINTIIYELPNTYKFLPILQIRVALCAISGFIIVMFYSINVEKFKDFQSKSDEAEKALEKQKESHEELKTIAYNDTLTDTYNRRYGMDNLSFLLENSSSTFAIVFIDLDGLKIVNDKFGHNEGDEYICTVVNILKNSLRVEDMLCRMGGDEFMILMPNCDEYEGERIVIGAYDSVNALSSISDKDYLMSISYGVVDVLPYSGFTVEEVIENVDARMYEFKKSRKKERTMFD